jgi:hypothetical protein
MDAVATQKNEASSVHERGKKMKKHSAVMLISVFTIMVGWAMIFPAYGQEKEVGALMEPTGFTIARLVVGTGIENREPVGVAETFPASTEKVYCFLEATNIAEDTQVSFVWFYGEKEMLNFSLTLKMGSRWRTNASKNIAGMKGDWKVELRDSNGNLLKEIKFKVE